MGSLGEILKKTRESKGITLEQVEEDIKIRKRYLEAIEEGNLDILPGRVYAKGFLRNYANYLGLSQEDIKFEMEFLGLPEQEQYDSKETAAPKEDIQTRIRRERSNRLKMRSYLITVLVALAAIASLIAFNIFLKNYPDTGIDDRGNKITEEQHQGKSAEDNQEGVNPPSNPPQADKGQGGIPERQDSEEPDGEQTQEGTSLTIHAKTAQCWLKVVVDGNKQYEGIIKPPESKTFTGNQITVRYGNAGAVEVIENGRNLGTAGQPGEPLTLNYPSS